jgi:alpha-glucosidase
MLGGEVLCAPVVRQGEKLRRVWLPDGSWVHLWTRKTYSGGTFDVGSEFGFPPVFFRADSPFAYLFRAVGSM